MANDVKKGCQQYICRWGWRMIPWRRRLRAAAKEEIDMISDRLAWQADQTADDQQDDKSKALDPIHMPLRNLAAMGRTPELRQSCPDRP